MAITGAFACADFTVEGPGGNQLNPGYATGNFNLNSYPVPAGVYSAGSWCGTGTPEITSGGSSGVFTLSTFAQDTTGGPFNNLWYWSYSSSLPWVSEVQIYFRGVQQVGPIYKDQYTIIVQVSDNTGSFTNTRCETGLLTMGDGSLYCTVFPFAISQSTNTQACTQCN